jgi:hypothetical protein
MRLIITRFTDMHVGTHGNEGQSILELLYLRERRLLQQEHQKPH